jgi:hypothetical protein
MGQGACAAAGQPQGKVSVKFKASALGRHAFGMNVPAYGARGAEAALPYAHCRMVYCWALLC